MAQRSQPEVPAENIEKLLPNAIAPSTERLIRYWSAFHKPALKYLGQRPLRLVRRVGKTIFFHKGPLPPVPQTVHQVKVERRGGGIGTRLWVDTLDGLLGLVEIGVIEVHPWHAKVADLDHPDYLAFNLLPRSGVKYAFVCETALLLRDILRGVGYKSWAKITGDRSIHVMAPIEPKRTHDEANRDAFLILEAVARIHPDRYTLNPRDNRIGRLLLDYQRNGFNATTIGVFSPRALRGFPVAARVTWKQIGQHTATGAFTIDDPFKPLG